MVAVSVSSLIFNCINLVNLDSNWFQCYPTVINGKKIADMESSQLIYFAEKGCHHLKFAEVANFADFFSPFFSHLLSHSLRSLREKFEQKWKGKKAL